MCGITGFWTVGTSRPPKETIEAMTDTMAHRGPDDRGTWVDNRAGVALGHRRLSIIDLSRDGAQPMVSASGRFVLVYNGEIYNFEAMRHQVRRRRPHYPFRGTSDTEVLLAAIDTFGLGDAVEMTNGMFCFALWDRELRRLSVARDRLGIKPLYYGFLEDTLLFGSELKPFWVHPEFRGEIDRQALADLLRLNSIPAPRSIYENISKLEPGTIHTFKHPDGRGRTRNYWSASEVATQGMAEPFEGSGDEAVEALEEKLMEAVEDRMVSDVPLGAFLSGGVDSSTVVALMQAVSERPVRTFSIGFDDQSYNEATDAAAVADHLGTDHTEHYVTHDDARSVIPRLPTLYDEPFADSSQIPTFLVSEMARRQVTVALSGDGGDELFGGYNRHFWAPRLWRVFGAIPQALRSLLAVALQMPRPARIDASYRRLEPILPEAVQIRIPSEKLQKLAEILPVGSIDAIYDRLRADITDPSGLVVGLDAEQRLESQSLDCDDCASRMMFRDLISYLPDDILTKVDRASMGVSLEARVPLLDHRVVEFAWRLPMEFKIRNSTSKWALRQVLYRHVPRTLIERPKMGFGIPIDSWLRGPLRDWAEALLDPTRLRREGYFRPAPIRKMWREHIDEQANHQHKLWNVLSFQAWLEQ